MIMLRFTPNRESYIPHGATKVADKQSDAVAYLYSRGGNPCAAVFFGKQAKPVWQYRFTSEAARAARVAAAFASRKASQDQRAMLRFARQAETHGLEVGHILKASWGYEQTNVNFYQVTKIISPKMIEIREIASAPCVAQTSMSGTVLPVMDRFTGEPMRKRAGRGGVKLASYMFAYVWDGKPVFESSWH